MDAKNLRRNASLDAHRYSKPKHKQSNRKNVIFSITVLVLLIGSIASIGFVAVGFGGHRYYSTSTRTTPHSIVDVRALSGWVLVGTSSKNGGNGADLDKYYVGWDDTNLYLNLTTHNTASWTVAYGFAIDVDQASGSGYSSNSTGLDAWTRKITFQNGNYLPDYEVYMFWDQNNGITSAQICKNTTTKWIYTDIQASNIKYSGTTGSSGSGLQWVNITIPWSDIGNKPTTGKIATMAWVAGDKGSSAVDTVPDDNAIGDNQDEWNDADTLSAMSVVDVPELFTPSLVFLLIIAAVPIILRRRKRL